jgi:hypothetical protein
MRLLSPNNWLNRNNLCSLGPMTQRIPDNPAPTVLFSFVIACAEYSLLNTSLSPGMIYHVIRMTSRLARVSGTTCVVVKAPRVQCGLPHDSVPTYEVSH